MLKIAGAALLLALQLAPQQGRLLELHGRGFSFSVLEPEGWELAPRAAPQIATFIFQRKGSNWRRADSVIYVRFVPREADQTVEEFMALNRAQFLEECPFAEDQRSEAPLDAVEGFMTAEFSCSGVREEIVAARASSRLFLVFVLSSRSPSALRVDAPVLRSILSSFKWKEQAPPQRFPDREPQERG